MQTTRLRGNNLIASSIAPISSQERWFASLSHLAVLLPITCTVVPAVILFKYKDKPSFVFSHALQAFAAQIVLSFIGVSGLLLYAGSFLLSVGSRSAVSSLPTNWAPPFLLFFALGVEGVLFCIGLGIIICGLIGAVLAFRGRDFHYPFLGMFINLYRTPFRSWLPDNFR